MHYYFRTMEQFEAMAQAGELLEWAIVFGRGYGTPVRQWSRPLPQAMTWCST